MLNQSLSSPQLSIPPVRTRHTHGISSLLERLRGESTLRHHLSSIDSSKISRLSLNVTKFDVYRPSSSSLSSVDPEEIVSDSILDHRTRKASFATYRHPLQSTINEKRSIQINTSPRYSQVSRFVFQLITVISITRISLLPAPMMMMMKSFRILIMRHIVLPIVR